MTRIIRITECAHCTHATKITDAHTGKLQAWWCQAVMSRTGPVCPGETICPPTGTPVWCPLDVLEQGENAGASSPPKED